AGGITSLTGTIEDDLPAVRRNRYADFTQPERRGLLRQAVCIAQYKAPPFVRCESINRNVYPRRLTGLEHQPARPGRSAKDWVLHGRRCLTVAKLRHCDCTLN